MKDIDNLYQYIVKSYFNYQSILQKENEIIITFHNEFEIKIKLQSFYKIYFNNIFYYDIDCQDIVETIDDLFTKKYAFCKQKNRIKIIEIEKLHDSTKFINIWTTERTLK